MFKEQKYIGHKKQNRFGKKNAKIIVIVNTETDFLNRILHLVDSKVKHAILFTLHIVGVEYGRAPRIVFLAGS